MKLAKENLEHTQQISNVEITQAANKLSVAQAQYNRDLALVNQRGVTKVSPEKLKYVYQIVQPQIVQATIEVAIAAEQYERDTKLVEEGALSRRQMLESQAKLEGAKARLISSKYFFKLIQLESELKRSEINFLLQKLRDSQLRVLEAKAQLKSAQISRQVLDMQAQIKNAQASVEVAQFQIQLRDTYNNNLKQLTNDKGLMIISAPITGTVAELTSNIGQSLQDTDGKLMTILNDGKVVAGTNTYKKDKEKASDSKFYFWFRIAFITFLLLLVGIESYPKR